MSTLLTRSTPLLLFIGILLFTYSFLDFLGIQSYTYQNGVKEGFTAPTRASDCRCLPGYIPSKEIQSEYGGEFQHYKGTIAFVPSKSTLKHWVPQCTMCGINICSPNIYKTVDVQTWEKTRFSTTFTCDILKRAKEELSTQTFFCQNTGNPQKRMSCY
jgi:hypothetical protein